MEKWKWGQIKLDGFRNEFQEGYIEVTPDAGIPFRRERFSDIQDIIQGNFTFDKYQYLDFMSWYKHDIRQGSIPFIYHDCRIGFDRVARIVGKPTFSSNSKYFDVSITLAFDSGQFKFDKILAANILKPLTANGDKYLIANDYYRYL